MMKKKLFFFPLSTCVNKVKCSQLFAVWWISLAQLHWVIKAPKSKMFSFHWASYKSTQRCQPMHLLAKSFYFSHEHTAVMLSLGHTLLKNTALHDWQLPLSSLSPLPPLQKSSACCKVSHSPMCMWWWWWWWWWCPDSFCYIWVSQLKRVQ